MTLHTVEEFGDLLRETAFFDVKVDENYEELDLWRIRKALVMDAVCAEAPWPSLLHPLWRL